MMRLVTDDAEPMEPLSPDGTDDVAAGSDADWPPEVDIILSAMDVGLQAGEIDRRVIDRQAQRCRAELRLHADAQAEPVALFTRDVSATGVGFITRERLPLGYTGLVCIVLDSGDSLTAGCNVYRCRESISGWYEGALHFTARQSALD